MMDSRITIRIDNEPFTCLTRIGGHIYIEEKIKKFFISDYDKGTVMTIFPREIEGMKVFPLIEIVNSLRPRILKNLAFDGFLYRINKAIEERNNPQERELSEFDNMILKAIKYTPKDKAV